MQTEFIQLHPTHPQARLVSKIADCLNSGGIIIYPTDTLYGLGCNINNKHAISRIAKIKGLKVEKANFSCICADMKQAGEYTIQSSSQVFKLMKRSLPGPFTFVLKASKAVPNHFHNKRKTIGIRVIDHPFTETLLTQIGMPLLSSSLPLEDGAVLTHPQDIFDAYCGQVDMVIDCGPCGDIGSTVIDCSSGDEMILLRQGKGEF